MRLRLSLAVAFSRAHANVCCLPPCFLRLETIAHSIITSVLVRARLPSGITVSRLELQSNFRIVGLWLARLVSLAKFDVAPSNGNGGTAMKTTIARDADFPFATGKLRGTT